MAMLKNPATKYRPFAPVRLADRTWPDAVLTKPPAWCSVDLRDGNQALIEPMDIPRKLRMFNTLVEIGFKEIEVGFPSASQVEFDFVRKLIDDDLIPGDVTIQVLTQAREELIRRTFESLKGARRAIVHLYNATAPVMRKVVLGLDPDGIVELATTHARLFTELAAQQPRTDWVFQYSPEMFSGTELEFAKRVVDAVTEVWQPTPGAQVHHQPAVDRGALHALHLRRHDRVDAPAPGAARFHRAVRCTPTTTAAPARPPASSPSWPRGPAGRLPVRQTASAPATSTSSTWRSTCTARAWTRAWDFSDIDEIRARWTLQPLPGTPRHPYVGDLVYTSFSGSHQDAIKKAFAARQPGDLWDMPYLPIDPKDLGRSYEAVIRVNSQSGKGGISYLLESEYGLELPRRLQIEFTQVVQAVMDASGKELTAQDLWTLFENEYRLGRATVAHQVLESGSAAGRVTLEADVKLGGRALRVHGAGNGPIDAFIEGLARASGQPVRVLDYHEHAIASGADARAVAYLELRVGDRTLFGVGMDANIVSASLKAIVSGLQRAGLATEQEEPTWQTN